jgi:putative transposase
VEYQRRGDCGSVPSAPRRAECVGVIGKNLALGLAVRHDHGSQHMSDAFQTEMRFLGIESSSAFVPASEGNGCPKRFIRTLNANLLWIESFDTVEQPRLALLEFREIYNTTWLIQRLEYQTAAQVRQDQLDGSKNLAFLAAF